MDTVVAREGVLVPRDYDELHRTYYPYVVNLVRRLGIEPQNSEDVASTILLRCIERDILGMFDAGHVSEHQGRQYQARFKTFLSAWVAVYVRHHRDQQTLRARREPLKCDAPVGDGSASWVEVFGPVGQDDYSYLDEAELVAGIRTHLGAVPRRSRQDRCDLVALFDQVVAQARTTGAVEVKVLARHFGVSGTAIHSWLGWMRVNIRGYLEGRVS